MAQRGLSELRSAVMPTAADRLLSALGPMVPDIAVTRIVASTANGDGGRAEVQAEVTRRGRVASRALSISPEEFRELIGTLLDPGQPTGAVKFHGFAGVAALPPAADAPLLLLHRHIAARVTAESVCTDGLLTAEVSRTVTSLLAGGSGVILAGPSRSRLADVLAAIAQLLPAAVPIAIVEAASRIFCPRTKVRLRELPASARPALGEAVLLIDLPAPPPLGSLTPPIVLTVTAGTPSGALSRLRPLGTALGPADAVTWAETAPLLLQYGHTPLGPRLDSVWEVQPRLDRAVGLPLLVMLLGTDPVSSSLVRTGAIPTDPAVRSAWEST